jgi:dynein heavy chain 2
MTTSEQARKFAKLARDLERIASFHNTIGDRMITSQRPLMLDAAVSLAQLVKEQTDMTWNNPDRVQRYIARLQQHVEQLARQNNKLAAYHKSIGEKVCIFFYALCYLTNPKYV